MLASRGTLVIESADYGHVYEMPNFGGLPTTTLDTKAKILDSLETAYFKATGRRVSLAEVLKKSSPLRKEGDVAKLGANRRQVRQASDARCGYAGRGSG